MHQKKVNQSILREVCLEVTATYGEITDGKIKLSSFPVGKNPLGYTYLPLFSSIYHINS